jgi:hypothetical protein
MKWEKKPLSPRIIPQSPERNILGDAVSSKLEVSLGTLWGIKIIPK